MGFFDITVVGERELIARFDGMPELVRKVIGAKMQEEVAGLLAIAKNNALQYAPSTLENHGPTGKLADSIVDRVVDDGNTITGIVDTDDSVPYARVQELGGGGGVLIEPKGDYYLSFFYQGKEWLMRSVIRGETPAKRYLRSALETDGQAALRRIQNAVLDAIVQDKA